MKILPLVVVVAILLGMYFIAQRAKQRTSRDESDRREKIGVGSPVMTTSGLYATVVSVDADRDTVILRIAPNVEVKWAFAALRDVASLPTQYRQGEPAGSESSTATEINLGKRADPQMPPD